jgi:hypothetical protein
VSIITLTKQSQDIEGSARPERGAGAPDEEIEITREMVRAGEAVLDRAFEQAGLRPSWTVFAALPDVYIAMESARDYQQGCASKEVSDD